jgi:hypothetical protein
MLKDAVAGKGIREAVILSEESNNTINLTCH